jgi:hypothetical protein
MIDPHRQAANVFLFPKMRALGAPDLVFAELQPIQRNAGIAQFLFDQFMHGYM